jgi:glutamyl-tRNA synthetase
VGDFVVRKGNGTAAYQLAVVVDDAAMGVTEVVRGDDLIASTPRQLLLYRALDLTPPSFRHVPLVVGPDGLRLAKRHGDTRVATFRQRGIAPERLVGLLAHWCGLSPPDKEWMPRDLVHSFDWRRIPRERIVCRWDWDRAQPTSADY